MSEELARAWAIVDMHTDPSRVAWALHKTQTGHQADETCWAIPGHQKPYEEWAIALIDAVPEAPKKQRGYRVDVGLPVWDEEDELRTAATWQRP